MSKIEIDNEPENIEQQFKDKVKRIINAFIHEAIDEYGKNQYPRCTQTIIECYKQKIRITHLLLQKLPGCIDEITSLKKAIHLIEENLRENKTIDKENQIFILKETEKYLNDKIKFINRNINKNNEITDNLNKIKETYKTRIIEIKALYNSNPETDKNQNSAILPNWIKEILQEKLSIERESIKNLNNTIYKIDKIIIEKSKIAKNYGRRRKHQIKKNPNSNGNSLFDILKKLIKYSQEKTNTTLQKEEISKSLSVNIKRYEKKIKKIYKRHFERTLLYSLRKFILFHISRKPLLSRIRVIEIIEKTINDIIIPVKFTVKWNLVREKIKFSLNKYKTFPPINKILLDYYRTKLNNTLENVNTYYENKVEEKNNWNPSEHNEQEISIIYKLTKYIDKSIWLMSGIFTNNDTLHLINATIEFSKIYCSRYPAVRREKLINSIVKYLKENELCILKKNNSQYTSLETKKATQQPKITLKNKKLESSLNILAEFLYKLKQLFTGKNLEIKDSDTLIERIKNIINYEKIFGYSNNDLTYILWTIKCYSQTYILDRFNNQDEKIDKIVSNIEDYINHQICIMKIHKKIIKKNHTNEAIINIFSNEIIYQIYVNQKHYYKDYLNREISYLLIQNTVCQNIQLLLSAENNLNTIKSLIDYLLITLKPERSENYFKIIFYIEKIYNILKTRSQSIDYNQATFKKVKNNSLINLCSFLNCNKNQPVSPMIENTLYDLYIYFYRDVLQKNNSNSSDENLLTREMKEIISSCLNRGKSIYTPFDIMLLICSLNEIFKIRKIHKIKSNFLKNLVLNNLIKYIMKHIFIPKKSKLKRRIPPLMKYLSIHYHNDKRSNNSIHCCHSA